MLAFPGRVLAPLPSQTAREKLTRDWEPVPGQRRWCSLPSAPRGLLQPPVAVRPPSRQSVSSAVPTPRGSRAAASWPSSANLLLTNSHHRLI